MDIEGCLMLSPSKNDNNKLPITIPIFLEDKQRIYLPWRFSLIIKLQGKRILHQLLKRKIQELWKINENPLIDLGNDYFTVKLQKEENMNQILEKGMYFIFGYFLSVQRWQSNFVAIEAVQNFTTVWTRLPQLPTKFYDGQILQRIGGAIERLLKVDAYTSSSLRGRNARLYIELPMEEPIIKFIYISSHKQQIHYEVEQHLCKLCGRLGHGAKDCPHKLDNATQNTITQLETPNVKNSSNNPAQDDNWHTVPFTTKRNQTKRQAPTGHQTGSKHPSPGIKVKLLYAATGSECHAGSRTSKPRKYGAAGTSSSDPSGDGKPYGGRRARANRSNRGINGGILKPKRSQSFSISGNAGEKTYSSLSTFTLQMHHGHSSTSRPNSRQINNDSGSQSKKEPNHPRSHPTTSESINEST
ncbi:uncharacterized protein [Nicotiana sylvestris]|uniref:uncharacterized protein n=1 Tax=Nicotiana sylvestris TaxID=4096 RepID=UPI00388C6623